METEIVGMVEALRRRSDERHHMQAGPPVLKVNGVSKRFCRDLKRSLAYGVFDICREISGRPPISDRLRRHEFWAVRDVNFEIPRGSAVGIVGTNGCGKTTLMRVMAGLIKPTTGTVTTRGRMAPLLALGAGFIPILTGRENIYTNMAVLGLTKKEIDARFQKVVEFSEIEYALDAPVQSFSSGMVARLGFSCAAETQPDILLLDEVLAVGDLKFKEKCLKRLFEMKDAGTSMILVHHSTDLLEKLCDQLIYMQGGQVVAIGPTAEIIAQYEADLGLEFVPPPTPTPKVSGTPMTESDMESIDGAEVRVGDIEIAHPTGRLTVGAAATVRVAIEVLADQHHLPLRVSFHPIMSEEDGSVTVGRRAAATFSSAAVGKAVWPAPAGRYTAEVVLPVVRLPRGRYRVRASALSPKDEVLASRWSETVEVEPMSDAERPGEFLQEHDWTIGPREERES
jgi:ABC-type polysaccharide/polyol phosphate transport system ATPase subunit